MHFSKVSNPIKGHCRIRIKFNGKNNLLVDFEEKFGAAIFKLINRKNP